jgi:pimeloyl-ACP methyl ester carboxylesterase
MGNSSSSSDEPSYYSQAKQGYQQLVNSIIRPPRCNYSIQHLGPKEFSFCGVPFKRKDFNLRNKRDMKIVCSHWEPQIRKSPTLPCLVYMHGNASGRIEAIHCLSMVLSLGITLLAFDFTGSGMSDGEYVSLGAFEKDDLAAVVEHLRSEGTTSTIGLWGRSMGAATALLHGERDLSIAAMILDSPFSSLVTLAEELVEKGRKQGMFAPSLVVSIVIRWIRQSVRSEAGFDIHDLAPIDKADRCFIPALFVAAKEDSFIPITHSQAIYDVYMGDKNIVLVNGDHSSPRPRFLFDSASIFLVNQMQIPSEWVSVEGQRNVMLPPWRAQRSGGMGIFSDVMDIFSNPSNNLDSYDADQQGYPFSPGGGREQQRRGSNRGSVRLRSAADVNVTTKKSDGVIDTSSSPNAAGVDGLVSGGTAMSNAEVEAIQETLFNTFAQSKSRGQGSSGEGTLGASDQNGDSDGDSSDDHDAEGVWTCARCTLNNVAGTRACAACSLPRAASASK